MTTKVSRATMAMKKKAKATAKKKKAHTRRAVVRRTVRRALLSEAQSRAIRESYQREAFWSETVLHLLANGSDHRRAISVAIDLVDERDARGYHRDPFERRYAARILREEREAWEDQSFWTACVHAMVGARKQREAQACAASADLIVAERRRLFGTPREILEHAGLAAKKSKAKA